MKHSAKHSMVKNTKIKFILLYFLAIICISKSHLTCMNLYNHEEIDEKIRYSCIRASISKLEQQAIFDDDYVYSTHDGLPEYYEYKFPKIFHLFLYKYPEKIEACCNLYILKDFPQEHVIVQLCDDIEIIQHVLWQISDMQIISCKCNCINLLQRCIITNNMSAIKYLYTQRNKAFKQLVNSEIIQIIKVYFKKECIIFPINSTPLHMAIKLGLLDLALILLQNGANPNIMDEEHKVPCDYLEKLLENTPERDSSKIFVKIRQALAVK